MNGAKLDRRVDAGTRLSIRRETEEHWHGDEQSEAQPPLVAVDERRVEWLLEEPPAALVAAHENEHADDGDEHVLKHDAARHGGARTTKQEREDVLHANREGQIRGHQQDHGLPERMAKDGAESRHFLFARKVTSASSCAAESICPKVPGIVPANFS